MYHSNTEYLNELKKSINWFQDFEISIEKFLSNTRYLNKLEKSNTLRCF